VFFFFFSGTFIVHTDVFRKKRKTRKPTVLGLLNP